jgi:small subunit ribosomal protein S1
MEQQRTHVQRKPFPAWIETMHDYARLRPGEVREAVILSSNDEVIVCVAKAKRDGLVPTEDLRRLDQTYRASLNVGDRVPVRILRGLTRDNLVLVSISQGLKHCDWLRAQDLLESGQPLEAQVTEHNRGGLVVSFGRLRGFVPNSHLKRGRPRGREAKSKLVGEKLWLVVLEVNQRRRRLVLSEREANARRRQQLLAGLSEGEVRTGTVRNLVSYGAFVDLGGVDGMIHISELGWKYVEHPRDVLSVDDEIEVQVLRVDRERGRIALSRKRVVPNPWYDVIEKLYEGDSVSGTVTRVVSYGAFVDIGRGVEGLVHVSDMPGGAATRSNLRPGSEVTVRVLEIDDLQQRISLAMPYAADLDQGGAQIIAERVDRDTVQTLLQAR